MRLGRPLLAATTGALVALAGWAAVGRPPHVPVVVAPADAGADADADDEARADDVEPDAPLFTLPSGALAELSCEDARRVVAQVRASLAYLPERPRPRRLSEALVDWIDPHGLLALADDAVTAPALEIAAAPLLADLESTRPRSCDAAARPARFLARFSTELGALWDGAFAAATADAELARRAAEDPLPTAGKSRDVARQLGALAGAFARVHGAQATPYPRAARARLFPSLEQARWERAIVAAALRAYVPLVDPHGAWAPSDEEASIYDVDLLADPPERLWVRATPTAVGARVEEGALAPLRDGDVALELAGVPLAGLPLEQLDQLAYAATSRARGTDGRALVLRDGKLVALTLTPSKRLTDAADDDPAVTTESVPYGDGTVLVAHVTDVRDDLGEALGARLDAARAGATPPAALVLDLRGNGGGSTEGAAAALGLLLPDVSLFPMRRRDGTVEVDRSASPRVGAPWDGPVAVLVDGGTASAAEMIAGAIGAYRRGLVAGAPTFGKGCAQEYVDDDVHAGLLRLTTLLFALPDGSALQRVGLVPDVPVAFAPRATDGREREALVPHAPPSWTGPDVRTREAVRKSEPTFPAHGAHLGPCADDDVCRALRALGARRAKVAAKRAPKP